MGIPELIAASRYKAELAEKLKQKNTLITADTAYNVLINSITALNRSFISGQNSLINSINKLNQVVSGQSISIKSEKNINNTEISDLSKSIKLLSKRLESLKPTKNRYTVLINKKGLNVSNGYLILDLKGCGTLKELTVSIDIKPDLYIKVNGNEVYNIHASYDDLSTISEFSDTVVAMTSISGNYILNIKDIKFTKSINVYIYFSGNATINNVFCIYDLEE